MQPRPLGNQSPVRRPPLEGGTGGRGLSIRGVAGELRIHRNTARKYAAAESPPVTGRRKFPVALGATINNNADWYFR